MQSFRRVQEGQYGFNRSHSSLQNTYLYIHLGGRRMRTPPHGIGALLRAPPITIFLSSLH